MAQLAAQPSQRLAFFIEMLKFDETSQHLGSGKGKLQQQIGANATGGLNLTKEPEVWHVLAALRTL